MVVEYIRYSIPAEQQLAFEQAYATASGSLGRSPHCLGYELARCIDDTSQYILRIEWDSAEGHMQGFRKSREFGYFVANVRPYIPAILEMRHYAVTSVTSAQSGGSAEP